MEQMRPYLQYQPFLRMWVFLIVLFLTLVEWAVAPTSVVEEKFEVMVTKRLAQFEVHVAALSSIPMLVQGFTRLETNILSATQSVASITNNIFNIEQTVGGLAARVAGGQCGLCFKRFWLGKLLELTWTW